MAPARAAAPAPDAVCVVSALNRNATMEAGGYYMIPGVPSRLGNYRIRAVCNDGTLGETGIVKPAGGDVFVAGPVQWGSTTPIPRSLQIDAPGAISYGQTVQLKVTGKGMDGSTFDLTAGARGTNYTSSNPQLASVSADGLLTVAGAPAGGRHWGLVTIGVSNEGTAGSRMIQIGPRGTLTGRVTLADGRTPAAGAQVTVQLNAPLTVYPVLQADAAGNFSMPDAPAGDYTLSALVPASGARGSMAANVPANGGAPVWHLKLSGQGTLLLSVLGDGGAPLPGAQLTVAHEQYAGLVRAVQSGANGEAQVAGFVAGPVHVSVRDPASGAVASARGELAADGQLRLTLQLQPTAAIAGRVLDGTAPQAGIQVRLLSDKRGLVSQAASGADGGFRFDSLLLADGPYTLQAVRDGRVQGSVGNLALAAAGQELRQDIVLGNVAAAGSVTGKVTDARGQVMADVDVTLLAADGRQFGARSDAQGRYRIDGVPLGDFMVSASQGGAGAVVNGVLRNSGDVATADLQLLAAGQVAGRLLLPDGRPAAGAMVTLRHAATGARQARSGADGQFNFGTIPLGTYALAAQLESGERVLLPAALTRAGEMRSHTLRLLGVATLNVQLRENGAPAAHTRVRLTLQGPFPYGAEALSDANGVARFEQVPKSAFSLSVLPKANGGAAARHEGVLRQDHETVALTLSGARALYSISGTVLDAAAKPVPHQWVRLSSRDMPTGGVVPIPHAAWDEMLAVTDAEGRFAFTNVSLNDDGRGRLKLDAIVDGRLRARLLIDTPRAGAAVQQDVVLFDAAAIAAAVRTPDGRPVPGMPFELRGFDDRLYTSRDFSGASDDDGAYLFMVPAGAWQVSNRALDGSQASTLNLTADAGAVLAAPFTLTPAPAYLHVQLKQRLAATPAQLRVDGQTVAWLTGSGSFAYVPLKAGASQVEVVTDYEDVQGQQVQVAEGALAQVVPLQFAFNPAVLQVRVQTSAALSTSTVQIDGRSVGSFMGSGVLSDIPLRTGQRELKIVTDYGDSRSVQLQVAAEDADKNLQESFTFNPPQLHVQVDAPVWGTRVTVGGNAMPPFAARQSQVYYGMQPGENVVVATAPSGKTRSSVITVGADDGGKAFHTSFLFDMALLKVNVRNPKPVAWTQVWLNDRYIGQINGDGALPPYPVAKGTHKVAVSNSDGLRVDNFVVIEEAQLETTVEMNFGFDPAELVVRIANTAPTEWTRVYVNGADAGSVIGNGTLTSTRLFVGDNQVRAVTASGDVQRTTLKVAELPAGLVLNTDFVFDRLQARNGTLAFDGERHLYSVAVQAGDKLSVRLHGAADGNGRALGQVQAQVYGADRELKAAGYGAGTIGNYDLTSTLGELMAIPVDADGHATIAVQARTAGEQGGYFMSVLRNGAPVEVSDFLDGGKVGGTVLRDDGVTPVAGTVVALRNDGAIGQHVRTVSGADGKFSFDRALAGEALLSALSDATAVATAPLSVTAGQTAQQDLRLPKETRLQVRVTLPSGVTSPGSMPVEVMDLLGRRSVHVAFGGGTTSQATEVRVLGDSVTLRASHPQLPGLSATQTVAGADGQALPVELLLRGAQARGVVRQATGAPAPDIAVSVLALPSNTVIMTTSTDAQGAYTLTLPLGMAVLVRAYDAAFDSYAVLPVAAPASQDLALPDILLGARATVRGLVRDSAGTLLAGAQVALTADLGGRLFTAAASSGADGRFQLDGVPAGVPLAVAVTAGPLNLVQRQSATAAPGQVLELPDFVFERGATLHIQLLDGDLQPNPVLTQASVGECGGNRLRLVTESGTTELAAADQTQLTGLPPGPVSVQLVDGCAHPEEPPLAAVSLEVGQAAEYTATLAVPVMYGVVTYADGRLVRYPEVALIQQGSNGGQKRLYNVDSPWQNQENSRFGGYHLVGLELGAYTVRASANGEVTVEGSLDKLGNVKRDLVLPAQPYDGRDSDVVGLLMRDGRPQAGVEVALEGADGWRQTVYTNEEGGYQFAEVPAGAFTVRAQHLYYRAERQGSAGNAPLVTLDLELQAGPYDGSASHVQGRVSVDGVGRAGLTVTLTRARGYEPMAVPGAPQGGAAVAAAMPGDGGRVLSTVTDAGGAYRFADVPAGDFTVQALSSWDSASAVGHAGSAPVLTIDLAIASEPFDGSASRLQGRVSAEGEGVPAMLTLESGSETLYGEADSEGNYAFERVKAGPFRLTASWNGTAVTSAGSAGGAALVTLHLALPPRAEGARVTGNVRHHDGQKLASAQIVLLQNGRVDYGWPDAEGNYSIYDVQPGPFVLRAEDGDNGLVAMVNGVGATAGTIKLDVVMPPAGTLSGTVTDHRGRALAGARVYLRSSGQAGLDRYAEAGADGKYRIERVALGQLAIAAVDPQTGLTATASQVLANGGQQALQDLAMPTEVAALEGSVVGEDGATPVAGAAVTFASSRSFDLADAQWVQARSDGNGRFVLPVLPTGAFSLAAADPAQPDLLGIVAGTAVAGQTLQAHIRLGTAMPANATLALPDNGFYRFDCSAALEGGRLPGTEYERGLDALLRLQVDGVAFPCLPAASVAADKRELRYGPVAMQGVQVQRRVYVPDGGGFARLIDTFSNSGAGNATVRVRVSAPVPGDGVHLLLTPAQTRYRYAILASPPLALVAGGAGANQASHFVFQPDSYGAGSGVYARSLTVPPGGSVSLMYFVALSSDGAAAAAMAEALAGNQVPAMLDELTPAQKAAIINFKLP